MIKVENVEVFNFEGAIRGMRNPYNSWDKSDSHICYGHNFTDCVTTSDFCPRKNDNDFDYDIFCIGKNDLALMKKLYKAGSEHRKYLRQIFVSMDITAPLYWWKEMDQYKIGVTTDSCSTMHRIHKNEFTLADFSREHLINFHCEGEFSTLGIIINDLNWSRQQYLETKKVMAKEQKTKDTKSSNFSSRKYDDLNKFYSNLN